MTQPTLFGTNERPKHRPVRETSRTAYQANLAQFTGRKSVVFRLLKAHDRARRNLSPTSAELAMFGRWSPDFPEVSEDYTTAVLYVRRGLSDLLAIGVVENPSSVEGTMLKRPCAVTKQKCYVWRVRQR